MNNYQLELTIAKELAKEAGAIMLKYFNSAAAKPTEKSDRTLVTKADIEINQRVIERLRQETPTYSIHGEEQSFAVAGSDYTWVCDPVDGTMPFAKALPLSTFSLGLVDPNGTSVLGVVYDPFQDRLFEAIKGKGAFVNGTPMAVSDKDTLENAYIDEELWINRQEGVRFDDPKDLLNKKGAQVTTYCSAVIAGCQVARGAFDAMLFGQGKPEDIAALSVIVTEAGGKVTDLFGHEQRYDRNIKGAVVSNGLVHDEICAILQNINYSSNYL